MSQSTTATLPLNGFGTCVTYGQNGAMGIGLPIEIDANRPVVIAHPAAACHYHASMSLFEDVTQPFLQVLVDYGLYVPDEAPYHADEANHAVYQRLHNTSQGHPVYRKASLELPHWQIHAVGDAYEFLTKAPPIDILYVDWLSWLDRFIENHDNAFPEMMAHFAENIRDGGLVILDHKHLPEDEYGPSWYNHPGGTFAVTASTSISEVCKIEWLGMNAHYEMQTFEATVFKVHHEGDGNLGGIDWSKAIEPWFWSSIPEMALDQHQIQSLIDNGQSETIHPSAVTWDNWHDTWSRIHIYGSDTTLTFRTPVPVQTAWPKSSYLAYLQWLIEHPTCLQPPLKTRTLSFNNGQFLLHLVHGDLLDLAPMVYGKNTVLAVRNKLQKQVVDRCPWWAKQVAMLQTSEPWRPNPLPGLRWSGPQATPNLTQRIIEAALDQLHDEFFAYHPTFECNAIVTVAHGTASLDDVIADIEACIAEGVLPGSNLPFELTIVHQNDQDYSLKPAAIGSSN